MQCCLEVGGREESTRRVRGSRAHLLEAGERERQRERGERERAHLLEREAGHGQGLVDGCRETRKQVLARRLELAPRDLQ